MIRIFFALNVVAVFCICGMQGCSSYHASQLLGNSSASSVATPSPSPSSTPAIARPSPISDSAYANWTIKFDDEFTSLDSISLGSVFNGAKWYNGTEQCCMGDFIQTPSGVVGTGFPAVMYPTQVNSISINPYTLLSGGGLDITLNKTKDSWYSGVLTTVDKNKIGFTQKYGYFEIKAKQPTGLGVWPAFWLLSTDPAMGGEIDIFEYYGVSQGQGFCTTLHDWRNGGTAMDNDHACPNNLVAKDVLTNSYHTYGMLWTESTMTFFLDGTPMFNRATPDVMKQPYYMLINNGVGGYWPTDQTPTHTDFEILYVRTYGP